MKDTIKKIGLVVFMILSAVLPQYADELKAVEADPVFWNTAVWFIMAVFAWFDKTPEQIINKFKKPNVK